MKRKGRWKKLFVTFTAGLAMSAMFGNSAMAKELNTEKNGTNLEVNTEIVVENAGDSEGITATGDVRISSTNFPDEKFRSYVRAEFDTNKDLTLSLAERNDVSWIDVEQMGITTLKGIEFFPKLKYLQCDENELTDLDVSQNTELETLWCQNNKLKSLSLVNNKKLQDLFCGFNFISSIEFGADSQLQVLNCSNNLLTDLRFERVPELKELNIGNNGFTRLECGQLPALINLELYGNKIKFLDLYKNEKLLYLTCYDNIIERIDLSACTELRRMECSNNKLQSLDLRSNTKLEELQCDYNELYTLDISANKALTFLKCDGIGISQLDVTALTSLEYLSCKNNSLTTLDISKNTKMQELNCDGNNLFYVNLRASTIWESLYCGCNYPSVVATRNASGCLELDMTSIPGMVADKVLVVSGGTKSGNKLIANKDSNKIEYIYDDTIRNGIANDPRLFTLTLTESAKKDYSLDDGVLTLYYPEKMPDFSNVDGKRAPWYGQREQIKWVKFEGSPTNIGNYAFYGCRNLKSITFKDGLKTIGDYAFSGCYALTYVRFVYTLDRIGKGAFQNDSFLETVLFEDDPNGLYIDEDAFAGCVAIKDVYTSYVAANYMTLGWFFIDFANESSNPLTVSEANPQLMMPHYGVITAEKIEKSLTYITRLNNYALYKVKLNSSLVIPEGIAEIGKYALAYTPCVNLQLPSTLKVIDSKAFAGNSKLQEVVFNGYCPYSFASDAFSGVTATIWYPTAGWRTADLQNYGGTLTWRDKTTPKITKQPSSVKNANVGDNISFTIAAVGMNLSYQWQYSRDGGESWTKDTSAISTTYQRTVAKEDNNLQIRCVVTTAGANSARSNVVTITVGEPIVISSQPQNAEVVENNTTSFKIVATGDTLSYQWQHSVDGGKTWTTPTSDSSKTANYKFKAVEKWNNTLVRCIITDQYGKTVTSNTASLKVLILPKITLQPTDVSCDAGKTAKFTLTATGTSLKYQWYYSADKGATWNAYGSESETATLSITTKASHNGWTLKCTVKDSYGNEIESSPVKLTVMTPLKITTQPQSAEVVENVTASFKIVATGDNLSYQWQYSTDGGTKWTTPGETTTSSRTANYKFKAVEKWNNMVLRCTITDGYGRKVTSNTVTLKVIVLPKITVQPQAVSCDVGKTATFTLTAIGTGLKYKWYSSADKGVTWTAYGTASTTPSLAVATKASHYGWMFKCIVADSYGNEVESTPVNLDVTNSIVITTQPQSVSLVSGSKSVFKVVATGEGLKYQWKYSKDQGATWTIPTATSAKTDTYSTTVTMGQNGVWVRCIITDKYGCKKATKSAKIAVTPSTPVIKTQPADVTVNAGEKAVFHVEVEGTGMTYQWKISTDKGATWKEATATSAKTATYSTAVTDRQDGVMVMCDITSKEGGKVSTKAATIHVIPLAPVIKTQPVDVTVNADEKAVFHVEAEGTGLTYQWKYSTDQGTTWKEATTASAKTATYSTVVTDRQNGVMVMCDVANKAGVKVSSDPATIHVNPSIVIKTQPKAVKTTAGTQAEFKVTATGEGLTYQWQYSLDKGATWKISTASCANTKLFTITAADKWNGMYLRCVITNNKGIKVTTNAVKLTVTANVSEVEIDETEDENLPPEEEEILPPVEEILP